MKILYIARTGLGTMGEAALANYVRVAHRYHKVAVAQTPSAEEVVTPPPRGVSVHDLPPGPVTERRRALFDVLRAVRPNIVHMIQSPRCYDDLMTMMPVFADIKWCLDFRSPHVGSPDAPILRRFQDMHLQVDGLITHSLESLGTNIPRRLRKVTEVPPGVDISAMPISSIASQQVRSPVTPPRRLVYVGSLSRTRNIDALIEMIARAVHRVPELKVDFYGAGNAEPDLRKQVDDGALRRNISFQGQVDQSTLWHRLLEYEAGIAYVPEAMFGTAPSLKSLEYAAMGLPVLASRTPGQVNFAHRHGFKFQFLDNVPEGLADALSGIAKDHEILAPNVRSANRTAAEALDWTRIVEERLLPLYHRLVRH